MIDVKQGIRTAFFQALSGLLSYNSIGVPVSDDMSLSPATASLYVLLAAQTGAEKNTFAGWASDETIDLDIISKSNTQGSKEPLDQVAGQILGIIIPQIGVYGLAPQPGMQILNVVLHSDRYLPLSLNANNTVDRRILTFKMYVAQL